VSAGYSQPAARQSPICSGNFVSVPVFATLWFLTFWPSGALAADTQSATSSSTPSPYREPFRPQFHFTPEKNWMNDPNGMVYYDGEYHLFYQYNPFGDKWGHMSWGHAVSPDLVHWQHLPVALAEEGGVMIFSGSAVVDWNNTSGFGKEGQPPLVAIYTGHYTDKPLQNQNIAYSNDKGRTWTKFTGNPVLDIGQKDFRDPKVFWHEPTRQWVMVVSLPTEHKVRFYASPNLKEWAHLSDFGPAGCTTGIWECPDLFSLAVDGNTNRTKWVLIMNLNPGGPAGGSGCQYFVGQFDGQRFLLDPSYPKPPAGKAAVPTGKVLADFESTSYGNWKTAGEAFGSGPAHPAGGITGFLGRGLVDSFGKADSDQGTLTSPEFKIDVDFISFLIGGGAHPDETGINLRLGGRAVRTATGNNSSQMQWKSWDVRKLRGATGQLEIFDHYSGNDWGHIFIDHIVMSNEPAGTPGKYALWLDYGRDCYAAVTWSGVLDDRGRRVVLGWMSNWDYAQDVPTSPWRSAMTVPRTLALHRGPDGLRILQLPVEQLRSLRKKPARKFSGGSFAEASAWLARQNPLSPLLDVEIELTDVSTRTPFSLILDTGQNEQTSVVCDPARSQLILDRTRSGITSFHRAFPNRQIGPLRLADGRCFLRLLIDTASLEVFGQNGQTVLTSILFPAPGPRTLTLAATGAASPSVRFITIHALRSAWQSSSEPPSGN